VAVSPKPPDGPVLLDFPRFYPILDIDVAMARGLEPLAVLDAWLGAGVRLVQVRAKRAGGAQLLDLADRCVQRAAAAGARLIVNDRADVARLCGAAGVHLGQEDLPPAAARRILPVPAIVGWSTHNDEQLGAAAKMPIDYVAIGPVYGTQSKDRPDPVVGLDGVRRAAALAVGRPVVAIGGITLATAPAVLRAGATSVAVIGDAMQADASERARAVLAALS
jgi:thiamine-phosphate pyrophosphorylase